MSQEGGRTYLKLFLFIMENITKRGIDMTREEKEDRKLELFDNILFGEKMIARGEATREELQSQFDEIEKELKKLN